MTRYYIGTAEINKGGGYCVEHFLFSCHKERPFKKVWQITQEWFSPIDEIDREKSLIYFDGWSTTVKPGPWLQIDQQTYDKIKEIIQEVR